jgi:ABC-2 family transporter protein
MTWLTWRQIRVQLAAVYALVAVALVLLAVTGRGLAGKATLGTDIFDALSRAERDFYYSGVVVLALAPAVIGAFWGAPMVARELEAGTHRLVWNQSVTRNRWLATKLGITTAVGALAVGALTFAVTWWASPIDGALSDTRGRLPSRLTPVVFDMRGIVPVAYVVFAVVLGVTLGVVLRRAVPAMALTLAAFTAVQILIPVFLRPHIIPPDQVTLAFSAARLDGISGRDDGTHLSVTLTRGHPTDWTLSNQTVDARGRRVALPAWAASCVAPPGPPPDGPLGKTATVEGGNGPGTRLDSCFARLNAEGYRQRIVYHPAGHFWPLQLAETALFLVISGLLTWFCFWWVRRLS